MTKTLTLAAALLWSAPAAAQTMPDLSGAVTGLKARAAAFSQAAAERRAEAKKAADEARELEEQRRMLGISEVSSSRASTKYSFRGEETFVVSAGGFATRAEAAGFCAALPGYRLGKPLLPTLLSMAGLPFPSLRANNMVSEPVFGGRTGLAFWVAADKDVPEAELSKGADTVLVLLDGCGPGCSGLSTLRALNEALARAGRPARRLPAVCAEAKSPDY